MSNILILLGAGFNLDANSYLPPADRFSIPSANVCHNPPLDWERNPIPCSYPLVKDLLPACFGPKVDPELSAEKLFSEAYRRAEWIPLNRLVDIIQGADHYLAARMACRTDTPYATFFQKFKKANFLSYNYDCLAELHLLSQGRWHPKLGFGMKTEGSYSIALGDQVQAPLENESAIVLHLHGSLYLYPVETNISEADGSGTRWFTLRSRPRFLFDPDSLCRDFPAFPRPELDPGYSPPASRFIPPISDKESSLEATYYRLIAARAAELLREASVVISIGYSFAECDGPSYDTLLKQLFTEGKSLLIVNPSADQVVPELVGRYSIYSPSIQSIPLTFAQWVAADFPRGTP